MTAQFSELELNFPLVDVIGANGVVDKLTLGGGGGGDGGQGPSLMFAPAAHVQQADAQQAALEGWARRRQSHTPADSAPPSSHTLAAYAPSSSLVALGTGAGSRMAIRSAPMPTDAVYRAEGEGEESSEDESASEEEARCDGEFASGSVAAGFAAVGAVEASPAAAIAAADELAQDTPERRYFGVRRQHNRLAADTFRATAYRGGEQISLGNHATAEAAAHVRDAWLLNNSTARESELQLNFPRVDVDGVSRPSLLASPPPRRSSLTPFAGACIRVNDRRFQATIPEFVPYTPDEGGEVSATDAPASPGTIGADVPMSLPLSWTQAEYERFSLALSSKDMREIAAQLGVSTNAAVEYYYRRRLLPGAEPEPSFEPMIIYH
mmetsp:Transcript_31888/g.73310  ORF Transcript_31888/g.73310 Transcript_31888/m.73310 type:complete len:380 (-) Transcript_31888:117-1256(-)